MNRLAPLLVLVLVTALFLGYGAHAWSWLAGPLAALVLWRLDRSAQDGSAAAPARLHPEPAPVD